MDCGFEEVGAFLQRELIEEGADSDPESVDASLDGFAEQRFQLYLAWWTLIKSARTSSNACGASLCRQNRRQRRRGGFLQVRYPDFQPNSAPLWRRGRWRKGGKS